MRTHALILVALTTLAAACAGTGRKARPPEDAPAYGEARRAADAAGPEQRAVARNNAAIQLLRSGKPEEAAAELAALEATASEPAARAAFAFNHGRALEAAGRQDEALARYEAALALDPGLRPAARAAFRALARDREQGHRKMASLSARLVARGQVELAIDLLREALREAKQDRGAPDLLVPLASAYAALPVTLERFASSESPFLRELAGAGDPWREPVEAIRAAYGAELARGGDVPGRSTFWASHERAKVLSALLKATGDLLSARGEPREALARYELAWRLDRENTDAVVYMAALLRERADVLDPGGARVERLVRELFMQKGAAYREDDLRGILRLHSVLGTIFEAQGRWGANHAPDGALFQWSHAASAAERLRREDRSFPPTPGIYVHLATCQRSTGDRERAAASLLTASEGFLELGEPDRARETLAQLDALPGARVADERVRRVRERLERPAVPP